MDHNVARPPFSPTPTDKIEHMGQATAYGRRHGKFLHLPDAPRSLITRSLRGIELAATETRHDNPVPGLSGQFPSEDAYLVSFKLRDYPDCECWERSRCVIKTDVRAGATYLYDLKRDPRFVIDKPYHSIFFYLPRAALDDIARHAGAKRIGELAVRDLPLSEIAISAGFANQSHFTRVFSSVVGVSPAAWRRETQGAPESET